MNGMDASITPHVNWLDGVPGDELDMARHASNQLHALTACVADFGYALEVFDESTALLGPDHEPRLRGMARMTMAAQFGALSVYHFQSILQSIRFCLKRCPTLEALVNTKALDASIKQFLDEFSVFNEVRTSIAHHADFIFKPADIEAHQNDDGSAFYHGTLKGRTLTYTRDHRCISLDISEETLEKLALIKLDYFQAFQKACGPRPQD